MVEKWLCIFVHSHFLYIFVVFSYFIHYNKRKRTGKTNLKRIRPGSQRGSAGSQSKGEKRAWKDDTKSTRGNGETVTASQAILKGLSDDGGLFVPTSIPALDVPMEKTCGYELSGSGIRGDEPFSYRLYRR